MPAPLAAVVFDDYNTSGVPSSGNKKVKKSEARAWGAWLESIITAFTSSGGLIYASLATLNADLAHAANSMAWVIGDATVANNGVYRKNGASGTGSWTRVADLPYSFVRLNDVGSGTANAIQLTSAIPTSASVLRIANVFEANTGNVTISENGATAKPLLTSSGNQISAGGLTAGMMIAYLDNGTSFRLLTDQASAAIVPAAEAAAALALSYANTADLERQWANKWAEQAEDSAVSSNLYLRSQELDNASWVKNHTTVTANATTAPDGTNTAEKIVENTDNAEHALQQASVALAENTTYTKSGFFKAAERSMVRVRFATNIGFIADGVFDLVAGCIRDSSGNSLGTENIDSSRRAKMSYWGNGWWRCEVSCLTQAGTTAAAGAHFSVVQGTTTPVITYTGDGTSGIYAWGMQIEQAPFASSYVPTTTAAVTMYSAKHWAQKVIGGVADGSITTAKLADQSVTFEKLGTGSVRFANLHSSVTTSFPLICSTRAALKATNPANASYAYVTEGKRCGFFRKEAYANWSDIVTVDTTEGFAVRSSVDTSVVWIRDERELTPQMFGAQADFGTTNTNDYSSIMSWFAVLRAVRSRGISGRLRGRYFVNQSMTWDYNTDTNNDHGMAIRGENRSVDGLYFSNGYTFQLASSGGQARFYDRLLGFRVVGNVNTGLLNIGLGDFSDAWNACDIDIMVNNANSGASATGAILNFVLQSTIRLQANGNGSGRPVADGGLGPMATTALWMRQVQFCNLQLALGNAGFALRMSDGYNYGNTFDGTLDIEEVDTAIEILNAETSHNTWLGGTIVSRRLFNATAGSENCLLGQNIGQYTGFTQGVKTGILRPSLVAY